MDKHLRLLFWEGLRDPVKDKARHKKDSCKAFADLISAVHYGEKKALSPKAPKPLARSNQSTMEGDLNASSSSPPWLADVCTAFAREVKEALETRSQTPDIARQANLRSRGDTRDAQVKWEPPTCYRCGQIGHIRRGCRNRPLQDQGNG